MGCQFEPLTDDPPVRIRNQNFAEWHCTVMGDEFTIYKGTFGRQWSLIESSTQFFEIFFFSTPPNKTPISDASYPP